MVREIRNEYDAEWYAWRDELARRKKLAVAEKEYALWKAAQKSEPKPRIIPISGNAAQKHDAGNNQMRFAF